MTDSAKPEPMEPEMMDGTSLAVAEQRRRELQQLFPGVFTETIGTEGQSVQTIDFERLKAELGTFSDVYEGRRERYGMEWPGKRDCMKLIQEPSRATLKPCREESVDFDTTQNLFIEGDNLEVLKLLQKSYYGKVKMIYIDPPYNTGKEFIYPDKYSESLDTYLAYAGLVDDEGRRFSSNTPTEGRFHTKWLSMMYPRLYLARNLMREDGVFFASIDDNEIENLRRLCDEVFGESNYLGTFVVKSTPNARNYGHMARMHDYCLMYAKNSEFVDTYEIEVQEKEFKYSDDKGGFNIHPLYNSDESFHKGNRPNLYYPFYLRPDGTVADEFYKISLERESPSDVEVFPPQSTKNRIQFVWRWGKDKAREGLNREIVGYKNEDGSYRIVRKMRHTTKIIRSMFLEKEYSGRRGTAEVESLLEGKYFSFPKPLALLSSLLKSSTKDDDIVLDFFAGSCTTAHALLDSNDIDNARRRFIMVQLPEPVEDSSAAARVGYKTKLRI